MDAHHISRIRNSPQFQELERKRSVFGWSLAILMIAIYASFIGLVAFDRAVLAQQIGSGPFTVAFPVGLGVIAVVDHPDRESTCCAPTPSSTG